MLLRSAGK